MDGKAPVETERDIGLHELYLAIISKYKDVIEEGENLTMPQLPLLVTPKNELVVKKAEEIKRGFGVYNYMLNFYEASIKAFYFVRDGIKEIILPIRFWVKPEDAIRLGLGDTMDRNILLCSILIALGNPSAKVLVRMSNGERKVLTYYEYEDKVYMLDLKADIRHFDSKEQLLRSLLLNNESGAYEFNDTLYAELD